MNGKSERLTGHYYCTKHVSDIFGVNVSTIKRWSDSGRLKCFRTLGGHRRYSADWIIRFAETFESSVASAPTEAIEATGNAGDSMVDALLSENDYRTLREVYFAEALKGDTGVLTRFLADCISTGQISVKVIYDEIVSKALDKIHNVGRRQKLNCEQQDGAIRAIFESFLALEDQARTNS